MKIYETLQLIIAFILEADAVAGTIFAIGKVQGFNPMLAVLGIILNMLTLLMFLASIKEWRG